MTTVAKFSLLVGWLWVLSGIVSGALLGLFFHRPDWAGGYGSFRRRLLRLGHIAFFGMALVNFEFASTLRSLNLNGPGIVAAAGCFFAGALGMPCLCFLTAWRPGFRLGFAIPVLALLSGVFLTLLEATKP